MAKKFVKPISNIKWRMAAAERNRSLSNFISSTDLIRTVNDFTQMVPSLVVVFSDSLIGGLDAAKYVMNYAGKYGKYPKVLCLEGISACKWIQWEKPLNYWMRDVLISCGIPEKVIVTLDDPNPVKDLSSFMKKGHYKHASIFAPRCYNLNTALVLKREIPDVSFKFFDKGYVSEDMAQETNDIPSLYEIFDMDQLDGLGLDMLLGGIIRLNMLKNEVITLFKNALPLELVKEIEEVFNGSKSYSSIKYYAASINKLLPYGDLLSFVEVFRGLMPVDVARKYIEKGYILGLSTKAERALAGLTEAEFFEMLPKRLNDFPWLKNQEERLNRQIEELRSFFK